MCVTVAVLLLAGVGLAQDPVKVDPKHPKVEFEDNQVRVLRITFTRRKIFGRFFVTDRCWTGSSLFASISSTA
jgi:hypothetical protein